MVPAFTVAAQHGLRARLKKWGSDARPSRYAPVRYSGLPAASFATEADR